MSRPIRAQFLRGFTLLEAVVAMTLFSMASIALMGWLSVNLNAIARAEAHTAALADARAGLAVMETINPLLEPRGERTLPQLTVRWQSTPIVERRPGKGPSGGTTIFDLALFELTVEVLRVGRPAQQFTLRRAGWEAVRPVDPELW